MVVRNKPFERCYWVRQGEFLAGCYPGDLDPDDAEYKLSGLVRAGIRTVINLTEVGEAGAYGLPLKTYNAVLRSLAGELGPDLRLLRHPVHDMDIPSPRRMKTILDAIDTSLAEDRPVYVHCWGGFGRTGTVVGCWLARHGIAQGEEVLEEIARLREGMSGDSPQTDEQCHMVCTWKAGQ